MTTHIGAAVFAARLDGRYLYLACESMYAEGPHFSRPGYRNAFHVLRPEFRPRAWLVSKLLSKANAEDRKAMDAGPGTPLSREGWIEVDEEDFRSPADFMGFGLPYLDFIEAELARRPRTGYELIAELRKLPNVTEWDANAIYADWHQAHIRCRY